MIIGADPGKTGCIVAIDHGGQILDWLHMPTLIVGSKQRVNAAAISAWLSERQPEHCFLEQVGAGKQQGASSMFTFGHAAGLLEGTIAGAGIPFTLVTPQRWKKHAGLIGTDKDAARSRCVQLYPQCREFDLKGKGQALADAVLIARYGLTTLNQAAA